MTEVKVGARVKVLVAPLNVSGISTKDSTLSGVVAAVDEGAGTVTVKLDVTFTGEEVMTVRADQVSPF